MIARYLDEVSHALSFDRSLADCVRQEVEDHLREAAAADAAPDRAEAERRAVENFGDPHALASQFAAISLARRSRRVGIAVVSAIAGVLIMMKARVAWYAAAQWTISEEMRALGRAVLAIDRWAFWLAAATAATALASIAWRRVPAVFHAGYGRHLRRAFLLCAVATASLGVSVAGDGVLTALQFGAQRWSEALIPIASMAIEIAGAGLVAVLLLDTKHRAAAVEASRVAAAKDHRPRTGII